MQELQLRLRQCANKLREDELQLKEARASLMKLHTEIDSLDNEIWSMEQDKSAGQSIWDYFASFLPGGVSRLEQQRQEQDRSYRGKIATRRIRETEKGRKLATIQSYETNIVLYHRQALWVESEIRKKKEKDLRDYQELAKRMAGQANQTQTQHRTQDFHKPTLCNHRNWWNRVEGRFRCSCCMEETRRFAFQCPGCKKIACAPCRDVLRRKSR